MLPDDNDENNQKLNQMDREHKREIARGLVLLSQFGMSIVGCVFMGVLLGRWLDGLLGTEPWLLLVCTFFGVIAAFMSIFDLAKRR